MTLNSQYTFLLHEGTPIKAQAADSAEDRFLIVDTLQDGQVHAVTEGTANELIEKNRLHVVA